MAKDRTPMKIPGKRTRKCVADARVETTPKRQPGRPPKRQKLTTVKTKADKIQHRPPRTMTQILDEVKLATIERLPNEVLHKIFSLAPNTDLARASPILALKMTDAGEGHYWTNLILEVMRSYWDTRLMDMRHVVLDEEVINNQSKLFKSPWITVERIAKAEDRYLEAVAADLAKQKKGAVTPVIPKFWTVDSYRARWKIDLDNFTKKTGLLDNGQPQLCRPRTAELQDTSLGVHDQMTIPQHLLSGPWETKDVGLLFWLVRAGAMIDYSKSSLGEVALNGLQKAIRIGNLEVIHLLDRLEIGKVVDTDILEAVVDCESKDRMDVIVRVLDILAMKEEKDFGPYESADQLFEKGEYFHQIRDWMDIIFRHYYQKISTEKSHLSATRINNEIAMFKSELTEHHREATRALIEITVSEHDEDEDEADDDGDDDE